MGGQWRRVAAGVAAMALLTAGCADGSGTSVTLSGATVKVTQATLASQTTEVAEPQPVVDGDGERVSAPAPQADGDLPLQVAEEEVWSGPAAQAGTRPNVVVMLLDDLSMDLVATMPTVATMLDEGASFDHFVVDSLCCVSRSALLTGQYPSQNGVLLNTPGRNEQGRVLGGWKAFRASGNERRAVNVRLQKAGYTTGFVGKYLNGYGYKAKSKRLPAAPLGWDDFNAVHSDAYDGWGFHASRTVRGRHVIDSYPVPPASASNAVKDASYVGTHIERTALDLIDEYSAENAPYFLTVAPYAPHSRTKSKGAWRNEPKFPPAFADRPSAQRPDGNCGLIACSELGRDHLPGFGLDARGYAPVAGDGRAMAGWKRRDAMGARAAAKMQRQRAQMVQSADRTLAAILDAVKQDARQGKRETVVIFTSDNGFHLNQFGMSAGKGSAHDVDVRVPFVVVGPGIEPGKRDGLTSNIDLAPTLEEWAGISTPAYRAGTSLLPQLRRPNTRGADHVYVQHTWARTGEDPDASLAGRELLRIPTYTAVRGRDGLLIRSKNRRGTGWEFYPAATEADPAAGSELDERRNLYASHRRTVEVARLKAKLTALDACRNVRRDDAWPQRCERLR